MKKIFFFFGLKKLNSAAQNSQEVSTTTWSTHSMLLENTRCWCDRRTVTSGCFLAQLNIQRMCRLNSVCSQSYKTCNDSVINLVGWILRLDRSVHVRCNTRDSEYRYICVIILRNWMTPLHIHYIQVPDQGNNYHISQKLVPTLLFLLFPNLSKLFAHVG